MLCSHPNASTSNSPTERDGPCCQRQVFFGFQVVYPMHDQL